ncbi:MAG TPA: 50S ribosomal protein L18 [Patescibacteria group bacterium]|nr:50S ribosomal protein L18 [Patescibacteria group bacterium]
MQKEEKVKKIRKSRRQNRIRRKILANGVLPRLSVFRSNKYIYAQVIDDKKGSTLASASEAAIEDKKLNKTQRAAEVGKLIAKAAIDKKVKEIVFDKGSYRYHGRVKALADGAREGGLVF